MEHFKDETYAERLDETLKAFTAALNDASKAGLKVEYNIDIMMLNLNEGMRPIYDSTLAVYREIKR